MLIVDFNDEAGWDRVRDIDEQEQKMQQRNQLEYQRAAEAHSAPQGVKLVELKK